MGIDVALPPPSVRITQFWRYECRQIAAAGSDTLAVRTLQEPSQTDGNTLVRDRSTAGYLATVADIAAGLYGIKHNMPVDSLGFNQVAVAHTNGRARVPVEEYWLGGTFAKVRSRNQLFRMDWGPTVIQTIVDGTGADSMWYGVGIGGNVGMSANVWSGAAFLGFLWDPRLGNGGATNWTLAGRAENATYFHNVDSGLSVTTPRHLMFEIGQENGTAIARWLADGGIVLQISLPGTAFTPTFTNDQRNWGPAAIGARFTGFNDGFIAWTALQGVAGIDLIEPLE